MTIFRSKQGQASKVLMPLGYSHSSVFHWWQNSWISSKIGDVYRKIYQRSYGWLVASQAKGDRYLKDYIVPAIQRVHLNHLGTHLGPTSIWNLGHRQSNSGHILWSWNYLPWFSKKASQAAKSTSWLCGNVFDSQLHDARKKWARFIHPLYLPTCWDQSR